MRTLPLLVSSASILVLATGCVTMNEHEALMKAYNQQRAEAGSIQATNDRLAAQNEGLVLQKDALEALLKKREAEMEMVVAQLLAKDKVWEGRQADAVGKVRGEWETRLAALASDRSNAMEFNEKEGKLTLEAGVYFKSGSADVNPAAKRTILQVCQALKDSNTFIQVVGHTDNVPLKKSLDKFPDGNWELSGKRALRVLLEMCNAGSIEQSRLSYVGRGEMHPVQSNENEQGRAKNRRVEIFIRER
jgi:chemotaxis protein MotB